MLASTFFPNKSAGSRWQAHHGIVQRYLEARSGADRGYADWIRVFEVGSASVSQSRFTVPTSNSGDVGPVISVRAPGLQRRRSCRFRGNRFGA